LPGAKPLKHGARVHFHAYTMETIAEVRLFDAKELRPGDEQLVQLRLVDPALLLPQDRFIVRQFSPLVTIGGGFVLDAFPSSRTRWQADVAKFLATLTTGSPEDILSARVVRRGVSGLPLKDVPAEMNIRMDEATRLLERASDLRRCDHVLVSGTGFRDAAAIVLRQPEGRALARQHRSGDLSVCSQLSSRK
jgi:selenocysteine-specific elongation factor